MDICLTSDLHEFLFAAPSCDVLALVGDNFPTWVDSGGMPKSGPQHQWLVYRFSRWNDELPKSIKHKILVPGNHCAWVYEDRTWALLRRMGWTILHNNAVVIDGVKFWGTGHNLFNPTEKEPTSKWALELDSAGMKNVWNKVPSDTDILLTHQHPYLANHTEYAFGHEADRSLTDWVEKNKPALHAWGHEHPLTGHYPHGETVSLNVSATDDTGPGYDPFGYVWMVDFDEDHRAVRSAEKVDVHFTPCRTKYRSPY